LHSSCVFSDLQSARLAGPGRLEITPGYSSAGVYSEGESEKVQNHFGVQVATGLSSKVDLRLRYEYVHFTESDEGVGVLGAGPKFGLVEDRVAIYTPVGFAFGSDLDSSETWQLQPTVLITYPFNDYAEVTASGRGVIWLNEDEADSLIGANVGLGLSSDLDRWVIRPEAGFLKNPGEEGTLWQLSVGLTIFSGSEN
jgi:hypothetical protein